jgi:anti-sigma factor RsiW
MRVTPEELAAYADGELEGAEAARVLLAVAASPELMRTVSRYRTLRERIGAEFGPNLEQEVPERLAALLRPPQDHAERSSKPDTEAEPKPRMPGAERWRQAERGQPQRGVRADRERTPRRRGWLALPVLAGALLLAGFLPGTDARELFRVPGEQPIVRENANTAARIVMSFHAADGTECQAFDSPSVDGIACRDGAGWKLVQQVSGGGDAALLRHARAMIAGPG